ncbi:proline dehydrogenase 2, mitochondrial-like [Impatiens glandulifera]|uniref:proline dehydrogenase 2, mitochondrial-like n=1 Tax=Impatiens glandulifera TaxID=253017 RepID=UPI001FB070C1|nr:proline dehydrogenase 2, mitochondrial-like [Impatiens glandulifera]
MANRLPSTKLLQSLCRFTRPLNSVAPESIAAATAVPPLNFDDNKTEPIFTTFRSPTDSILNLHDVRALFSTVSTPKFVRSALNLHASAIGPMVDLGTWVMNSKLLKVPILREATLAVIRHTVFQHFCAGETPDEAGQTASKLWEATGIRGMLVYGLEHASDNDWCDRNLQGFLQTVESARSLPQSSVSFVVVKITAICPMDLLRRVSDHLRWQHRDQTVHLPWKRDTLPIFSNASPLYHTLKSPPPLTAEEEQNLELAYQRLHKLYLLCCEANVPLMVDAEDTIVQPAIDYLTYSCAISSHGQIDDPILFNTIQTYLKDARERLFLAQNAGDKMGVPMGFKLVRGAYMSSEGQLASHLGSESPIHNSIEETHACFDDCTSFMLEKIAGGGRGAVVLASHNLVSGMKAASKATELGIEREDKRLQFAQLYGMADALSFSLRNAGFHVSKYMPFGPVELVMPYLLRRAEENKGVLATSSLDRQLVRWVP